MVKLEILLVAVVISGMALAFAAALSIAPAMNQITSTTGNPSSTTTVTTVPMGYGTLAARFEAGPTVPVCHASATQEPAPTYYSSIEAVVTDSSGRTTSYAVDWASNGCYMIGTFSATMASGSYSLNLTSCSWMGCRSALPRSFVIYQSLTTTVDVSINTGIA